MRPDYVKVRLLCDRCRKALDLCVQTQRKVPEPLECAPGGGVPGGGGGGGGQDMSCAFCGLPWHMDSSLLLERVNDATRRGWGEHMRDGAVVLHCPAA
jgi:hypothetical protein